MKKEDIRIGNILFDSLRHRQVEIELKHFQELSIAEENFFDRYKPIVLTEDLVLKFGFCKRQDGHYNLFTHSEVDIIIDQDLDHWSCDGICFSVNSFGYMHQLQNLYVALTGEELNLNK